MTSKEDPPTGVEALNLLDQGAVVAGLHVGVGIHDHDGRILYANEELTRILGRRSEDLLGRSIFDSVHEGDLEDAHERVASRRQGGSERFVTRVMRPNGDVRLASIGVHPALMATGEAFGSVVTMSDVTAERALRDELESRVAERTAALEMANRKLALQVEERMAAEDAARWANRQKTAFLSSVSHELRTPLTAVLGYTELVLDQPSMTVEEAAPDLGLIHYSATHLLGLIDDILDLAKLDLVAIEGERPAHLTRLIADIVEVMRHRVEAEGAVLQVHLDSSFVCQQGAQKLKHVLFALLGVAARYTQGPVVLSARDSEEGALISVGMTGAALTSEAVSALFEPFLALGEAQHGGVGLAVTLEYVRALRGRLEVEDTDVGKAFFLFIPAMV